MNEWMDMRLTVVSFSVDNIGVAVVNLNTSAQQSSQ